MSYPFFILSLHYFDLVKEGFKVKMSEEFPLDHLSSENENDPLGQDIEFHAEDIDFEISQVEQLRSWIKQTIIEEQCELVHLNYIFCSDSYLHQINVEYLDHDTLTDVITFPYLAPPNIEGDIFISIDRIKENATSFDVGLLPELYRVMIHGLLHLCGYGDKTPEEKTRMTEKENEKLAKLDLLL